jgi:hypothetical protein
MVRKVPWRGVGLGLAGLWAVAMLGCLHAPMLWSPDGRWLAYTMAVRSDQPSLEPGWLFETAPRNRASGLDLTIREAQALKPAEAGPRGGTGVLLYRLWATRADTGESVLLENARGPLTTPCWSPGGQALAFGRLVPEGEGRARFEVVVQEAPDRQRILLTRPVNDFQARAGDLPGLALAWSPDGRYLAVPLLLQTLSLGIIRADNGRLLKIIEDAYLPSWSPDGTRLAFVQGSDQESLAYIDHNFAAPRHLAEIGQTSQAPCWFRDGRSLAVLARRAVPFRRQLPLPSPQVELLQVHIESGKVEPLTTLVDEPGDRDRAYNGSSFSFDRDGTDLFYVSDIEGQLCEITWYRPGTGETVEKFHPLDPTIRIGALAVSPQGKTLALRVGSPGDLSVPALWDLESRRFTPLVADDAARLEWLALLVRTAQTLLRGSLPARDAQNHAIDRPTLLPVLGELPSNPDIGSRLHKLARIGRPLCDRPDGAPTASPALLEVLAEARLFFDYLREDYPAALASIEALESHLPTRDQRLRLLSVRAQVYLAQKQFDQATQTIAFLQSIDARPGQVIEQTPNGPALSGEPNATRQWPAYLSEKSAELASTSPGAGRDHPLGNRNPDNPNPNADLLPGLVRPLPLVPMIQVPPDPFQLPPGLPQPPEAGPNRRLPQ